MIVRRMLRGCGAEHIVKSQEFADEIAAMDEVHAAIPGKDDSEEGQKSLPRKQAKNGFR